MQRTDFGAMSCPIARGLERVGEWWSMLILRDAFLGLSRFDEFQKSLGIAPNMLARRLAHLVEAGLLEKHRYCQRPPRHEYLLTRRGEDFRPVLLTLLDFGNRHYAPDGCRVQLVDTDTGEPVELALIDRRTGAEISRDRHRASPGPVDDADIGQRLAFSEALRSDPDNRPPYPGLPEPPPAVVPGPPETAS